LHPPIVNAAEQIATDAALAGLKLACIVFIQRPLDLGLFACFSPPCDLGLGALRFPCHIFGHLRDRFIGSLHRNPLAARLHTEKHEAADHDAGRNLEHEVVFWLSHVASAHTCAA
jgi:hypothetical protein